MSMDATAVRAKPKRSGSLVPVSITGIGTGEATDEGSKVLTKNEIAAEIEVETGIKPNLVKRVLDVLAAIAEDEIAQGNGFSVPGIVKIDWAFTSPLSKGEKYKKGETYVGFGGVEQTAEEDSKARKASVKLRAAPAPAIKRLAPKKDTMGRFLTTKAGKSIVSRKG